MTISVMESWISFHNSRKLFFATLFEGKPNSQYTPRSIRFTAFNSHSWAISVAFDDHGEIVPSRGTTQQHNDADDVGSSEYLLSGNKVCNWFSCFSDRDLEISTK